MTVNNVEFTDEELKELEIDEIDELEVEDGEENKSIFDAPEHDPRVDALEEEEEENIDAE